MAVGDIERLVEGLVGRGLISPKMVGRTVGQATIDELQNLGRSVNESQMRLQREQESRISDIRSQVAKQAQKAGLAKGGFNQKGQIKDITKPFVIGHNLGSDYTPATAAIAIPTEKGIQIRSKGISNPMGGITELDALTKMAFENIGMSNVSGPMNLKDSLNIPKINTVYHGSSNYQSLQELMNEMARQTTDVSAIQNLFGGK